jgi:hypothetical protein
VQMASWRWIGRIKFMGGVRWYGTQIEGIMSFIGTMVHMAFGQ